MKSADHERVGVLASLGRANGLHGAIEHMLHRFASDFQDEDFSRSTEFSHVLLSHEDDDAPSSSDQHSTGLPGILDSVTSEIASSA
jgi:hypothetical protein